jgi:uncharacterized protein (TIGR02266 family)
MSEPTPKDQRGPTNLRIKFRSATLEQFIERYAADVSRGGVFIRTREPLAVGTQLRLELQLQDATPLLSGEGTVIWIRENDPSRQNVAPGMAVRFDKLSPDTEPTLDRILEEKARLEQAGNVPAQPGSGLAVRRPSAVFSPLEAGGQVTAPVSSAPTVPVEIAPPEGAGARAGAGAAAKTSFMASGSAAPAAPGPFTRARNTTTRPVPVPSALFEPPTAADIDKALSVLEEAPGPAPAAPPPRFAPEDGSAVPTRVGSAPTEGVTAVPEASGPSELPPPEVTDGAILATDLKLPPPVPGEKMPAVVEVGQGGAVGAPAAPEVSRRFRAASKAYPTINRRRGTTTLIILIVVLGAAGAAVWKLRPGTPVPAQPVSIPAQGMGPAPGAAPAPSTPTPPPAAAEPAAPAPSAAAPPTPPTIAPLPPRGNEKAAEKEASSSDRHKDKDKDKDKDKEKRRRSREEASSRESTGKKAAAPATEKPAPEAAAPAPEAAPAETKPAAEKEAAPPPAAEKPAAATSVLKITSSPAGAEVLIDGNSVGITPFSSKEIDPGAPHAITLKKDGFETHERMIGASDWSRPHGSSPAALKVSVKLHRLAAAPAESPREASPPPAEDTGGPYIKEVTPSSP